jgi:hypothetical protein
VTILRLAKAFDYIAEAQKAQTGRTCQSALARCAGGQGSQARVGEVAAIVASEGGKLYVADRKNFAIRKVTPDGLVTTIAGAAAQKGTSN